MLEQLAGVHLLEVLTMALDSWELVEGACSHSPLVVGRLA
jgi:hypothetical protein